MAPSFLPEDDHAFLASKRVAYREVIEGEQRGLILPAFALPSTHRLLTVAGGSLQLATLADVLIFIPKGYRTTKLDSFYTNPHLKLAGGSDPQNATGTTPFAGVTWQFWSRHLGETDWNAGIDGLDVFLQHIKNDLRRA
jgi:Prokaryotic E2 family E